MCKGIYWHRLDLGCKRTTTSFITDRFKDLSASGAALSFYVRVVDDGSAWWALVWMEGMHRNRDVWQVGIRNHWGTTQMARCGSTHLAMSLTSLVCMQVVSPQLEGYQMTHYAGEPFGVGWCSGDIVSVHVDSSWHTVTCCHAPST